MQLYTGSNNVVYNSIYPLWLITVSRFTALHRCAGRCTWLAYGDVSDSLCCWKYGSCCESWRGLIHTRGGSFGINITSNKGRTRGMLCNLNFLLSGTIRTKMVPELPNQNLWLDMGCVDRSFHWFSLCLWDSRRLLTEQNRTIFLETKSTGSFATLLTTLTVYKLHC